MYKILVITRVSHTVHTVIEGFDTEEKARVAILKIQEYHEHRPGMLDVIPLY